MNQLHPSPATAPWSELTQPASPKPRVTDADAAMTAYVAYLAGWFEIGRLAAGRRLTRAGCSCPLLNDA